MDKCRHGSRDLGVWCRGGEKGKTTPSPSDLVSSRPLTLDPLPMDSGDVRSEEEEGGV